jgi:hypothetical protein
VYGLGRPDLFLAREFTTNGGLTAPGKLKNNTGNVVLSFRRKAARDFKHTQG